MNKHKLRLVLLTALCVLALAATFTISAYHSFKNVISSETKRLESGMAEASEAGHAQLESALLRLTDECRTAAKLVTLTGADSELLYRCFDLNSQGSHSDAALLFGEDGSFKYGALEYRDLFNPCAAESLRSGAPVMSDSIVCSDGVARFAISVPCTDGSGAKGAVTLLYPIDVLTEPTVSSSGMTLRLLNAYGSAVVSGAAASPWQLSATGGEPVLSAISGQFTHCTDAEGADWLLLSTPTGVNSWYLVCGVPMSYVYSCAANSFAANNSFIFVTFAILTAMVVFGVVFFSSRQKKLALERQRFNFATSQSNRAVFEYCRNNDRLSLISNCENISLPEGERHVPLSWLIGLLHPDDRAELGRAIGILNAEGCTQVTIRMRGLRVSGDYHWYHLTAEELTRASASIVIGTLEDIDEREKERIALLHKAVTDPLTGLYNRAETERMINERLAALQEGQSGTFCIVDMDNFKLVNDTNGHDCGDRALMFFAERLRSTFRFGDIIGRLGGDEFLVYMCHTSDREVVLRRFDDLMESLDHRCGEDCRLPELACSIGCVAAQPGDNFGIVYNLADKALYRAKTSGKRKAEFEEPAC